MKKDEYQEDKKPKLCVLPYWMDSWTSTDYPKWIGYTKEALLWNKNETVLCLLWHYVFNSIQDGSAIHYRYKKLKKNILSLHSDLFKSLLITNVKNQSSFGVAKGMQNI